MISEVRLNELAEFLGWHLGDGCISVNKRYSEYALTGDITEECLFYQKVILPTFNRLFESYLGKRVRIKKYDSVGVCGLFIFDKSFVKKLQNNLCLISGKKINIDIPKFVKTDSQKIHFLRGLFDTDGSIYFCKSNFKTKNESLFTIFHYRPKIKLATISKRLIEDVYNLLLELDFSPRMQKPCKQRKNENVMYSVVLDRNQDTLRWINNVGFRNPKHSTKINLWKKFGFCPPHTSLDQRAKMLKGRLNPLSFYSKDIDSSLEYIKNKLSRPIHFKVQNI